MERWDKTRYWRVCPSIISNALREYMTNDNIIDCHWSNFYWLRFPFPNIEKYNLGKVYISAKQPIEFNSELDDKSRFENVDHLEKYIIWWVTRLITIIKHFIKKKRFDMYDIKTYVDFYFWEYMWLSDWLILCNFTPEMVSIFQEQFFWWICCGETVEIYVCQRSSSHSDVIISVGSSEPVTVRVSVSSWNRLTFPLSLSLSLCWSNYTSQYTLESQQPSELLTNRIFFRELSSA